jgi:hypothetical protein
MALILSEIIYSTVFLICFAQIPSLQHQNIVKVLAAGDHFSLVLDHFEILLYSFGHADFGQLGLFNDTTTDHNKFIPRRVAFSGTKTIRIHNISTGERMAIMAIAYRFFPGNFGKTTGKMGVLNLALTKPLSNANRG